MIKAVIFDIDNTLYSYEHSHEYGMRSLAAYCNRVFGVSEEETEEETEEKAEEDEKAKSEEDKSKYAIYDENNIIDMEYLKSFYPNSEWQTASSNDELEKLVKDGQVEGGFEVESLTKYTYFVKNKGLLNQ